MILYDCKELSARWARSELEDAGAWTRLMIRMHLAMCAHCRRYAAQLRLLAAGARRQARVDEAALEAFKARLIERLR